MKNNKSRRIDVKERFEISFEMRKHGWIILHFTFSRLNIDIWLSSIFDPIPDLLNWINNIYDGAEISFIEIDEEGLFKRLHMEKMHSLEKDLYLFKIIADPGSLEYEYSFKKIVSRETFISKFVFALKELATDSIDRKWYNYVLSEKIIENIKVIEEQIQNSSSNIEHGDLK